MTIKASAIMERAQSMVRDIDGIAYTETDALEWINDGESCTINLRRDIGADRQTWQLTTGVHQTLPAGSIQLMGGVRNMGTDGLTPGDYLYQVDEQSQNAVNPGWSAAANNTSSHTEYCYNSNHADEFRIIPPSDGTGYVEASVCSIPTRLTDIEDNINVGDQWKKALVDFVCWCWLGRDDERSPNYQRAQQFKVSYLQSLGLSAEAKIAALPRA
jgi:hypothetical protein